MEKKAMCSGNLGNSETDIERDLWSSLLRAEGVSCSWKGTEPLTEDLFSVEENPNLKTPYPWNPAEPEAESFFNELEQGFSLDDWQEEEVSTRASDFFARVNQLWSAASLQESLVERFAARIPQELLRAIAGQAQQALVASQSLADQLVQCVQNALPNLAEEDLYVLARPLAYPMRNGESRRAVDSTLEKIRTVAWEELSEVEQARLSLAVACCALLELKSEGQK
jgi:hypothetical protein